MYESRSNLFQIRLPLWPGRKKTPGISYYVLSYLNQDCDTAPSTNTDVLMEPRFIKPVFMELETLCSWKQSKLSIRNRFLVDVHRESKELKTSSDMQHPVT